MDKVKVSVIIPVYNAEKYLRKCLDSVFSQNINVEVIVIDDGSNDSSIQIINEYSDVKLIQNLSNQGPALARNKGIELAHGDYIAFLDADDYWEENKLIQQIALMEEMNCDLCYSARRLILDGGIKTNKVIKVPQSVTYEELLKGNVINCSSVLVKKDLIVKYKFEDYDCHEDYLLWLKMLKDGCNAKGINEPLLNYRLSKNAITVNKIKSMYMTYKVYKYLGLHFMKRCNYILLNLCNAIKKYYLHK